MVDEHKDGICQYVKSKEDYDRIMGENHIVIVIYSAVWCGPCRTFKSWIHDEYKSYPHPILVIDVEELEEMADDIKALPTMFVYENCKVVMTTEGFDKQKMKGIFDDLALKAQEKEKDNLEN